MTCHVGGSLGASLSLVAEGPGAGWLQCNCSGNWARWCTSMARCAGPDVHAAGPPFRSIEGESTSLSVMQELAHSLAFEARAAQSLQGARRAAQCHHRGVLWTVAPCTRHRLRRAHETILHSWLIVVLIFAACESKWYSLLHSRPNVLPTECRDLQCCALCLRCSSCMASHDELA